MPYQAIKEHDEFCVYKIGPDGEPTGETLGCHDSRAEADKQMAALYANEPEAALETKAAWSVATINQLPDSAFLWIEPGGEKDDEGKTTSRALRHFPYRNEAGEIDLPHLRNALGRIPQSQAPADVKARVTRKAQALLEEATQKKDAPSWDVRLTVKALGEQRVGGYLALWGGPEEKDLTGEWFTPQTAGLTRIYDAVGKLPMLYAHGKDAPGFELVGAYDVLLPDATGLWAEGQLDKANRYYQAVQDLIRIGVLGQSSQTLASARQVAADGEIKQWVIAEGSLTPSPADARMIDRPVEELKAVYKALNIAFPNDEGPEPEGDEESRRRALALERERIVLLDL